MLLVLIVTVSGCYIDDWDGETLEGDQFYELSIEQIGTVLRMNVTVDEVVYEEVRADENFKIPEELFFWISPVKSDEGLNYPSQAMFPATRQRIKPGDLFDETGDSLGKSYYVDIDLARYARDWNIGWLDETNFDGDADIYFQNDMRGCYVFMSDGYAEWDEYYYGGDDYYYSYKGFANSPWDFGFSSSRPSGLGYSDVEKYPDNSEDEEWIAFTLLGEGLYVSKSDVLGGEVVRIALQIREDQSFTNSVSMTGYYDNFILDLDNNNDTNSTDDTIIWDLVFEPESSIYDTPTIDGDILHLEASKEQSFELRWNGEWQINNFYYLGSPSLYMATDFDGMDTVLSGNIGSGSSDFVPTTDYLDWPVYGNPDNDYNNWIIDIPDEIYWPESGNPGNVLGLGNLSVNDYYDSNRNDLLTFPEYSYPVDQGSIILAFDYYKDFDWNWYDSVTVEGWNGSYWEWINNISGPLEQWQLQETNGWSSGQFYFSPIGAPQQIRLRFNSNDWDENVGIFIDNIKILTLE